MKKGKPLKPITLPTGYQDESSDLDSKLRLISELLIGFTNRDFILDVDVIHELGRELERYLRSRNALEVCVGRMPLYSDFAFTELVRGYRRRFKEWNE